VRSCGVSDQVEIIFFLTPTGSQGAFVLKRHRRRVLERYPSRVKQVISSSERRPTRCYLGLGLNDQLVDPSFNFALGRTRDQLVTLQLGWPRALTIGPKCRMRLDLAAEKPVGYSREEKFG
jgi:hypothetical protein